MCALDVVVVGEEEKEEEEEEEGMCFNSRNRTTAGTISNASSTRAETFPLSRVVLS